MMNTPAAPLSAIYATEAGVKVLPSTADLAREHALAWADEKSLYACAGCAADLPRGFAHTRDHQEFLAIWP